MFDDTVRVGEWQQQLAAALASGSGLEDRERLDTIRELEELVCTATAAQAALAAELESSSRAHHAALGEPAARQGRGVAAQVAWARRESPHRGQRHLTLARVVASELPCTWQAWRTGRITEWTATLIARQTDCLSLADRRRVDFEVARNAEELEVMSPRQVEAACAAWAARLDPVSVIDRRRRAEKDRHVSLRPAPDTMTRLSALLPVKDGVAVYAVLSRMADVARAAGDPRSRGQVMADALVAAVKADGQRPGAEPAAGGVAINLVMSDSTLFGDSEDPAWVDGYGPVPADLAREIVADACTREEQVWLRRLYTSPTTGELVTMDTRARRFRHSLARFIRLRDQVCRTPWCHAPVRHADHADDVARGGPTSAVNGQGLCEACNHAKQAPGWTAVALSGPDTDSDEIETTMPTGHRYRTRPPPLARIHHRHDLTPISIDYYLAG